VDFRASKREILSQIQGLVKKNYDLFELWIFRELLRLVDLLSYANYDLFLASVVWIIRELWLLVLCCLLLDVILLCHTEFCEIGLQTSRS
jgi:hypothetical protein